MNRSASTGDWPTAMRAAVLTGHGGPDRLVMRSDVAVPSPGPGSALIRVGACGVNNTDINTRIGWYDRSVETATGDVEPTSTPGSGVARGGWNGALAFPRIQGADVCGRVMAAPGAGVSLVGRRVLVDPWVRVNDDPLDPASSGYLGSEHDGGFAEFVCVPLANIHEINSPLTDEELSSFPCSASTAENMLRRVRATAGDTVVVTGASGGVGTHLVQLAHLRGARVVAVVSRSKGDAVADLGADVVVARESADVVAEVGEAAGGGRVDVVADVVGGSAAFAGWLDLLRPSGRYITAGAIAGPIVPLDLRTLYLKDLELHGVTAFPPRLFADVVGLVERGALRPVLARVYPLEEIHAAQAFFAEKHHVGSISISVAT